MEGMILAALISTAGLYHCTETRGALECRHASTPAVARAKTPSRAQSPAQSGSACVLQLADASPVRDDQQAESHAQCVSAYRNRQYDSMNETWHVDRIRACDELNARRRSPVMEASQPPQAEPRPQTQAQEARSVSIGAK